MINNVQVGKTIARLRQSRDMTQQQLASALNVSHQAVSKWETGAALPDIQTMIDLTRLFGITIEQLVTGDIPEDRLKSAKEAKTDGDPLQNIGSFVNNIVSGIFGTASDAQGDEDDGAEEPFAMDGAEDEEPKASGEPAHVAQEDSRAEGADKGGAESFFDINRLLQMAPFMSRQVVDRLLQAHRERLSPQDVARFAPFISRECLESLMTRPNSEINWDVLQHVAPFLKREVVDRLTQAAAQGERIVHKAADDAGGDDIGKAFDDVTQKIGSGVERVARRVAELGEGAASAINGIVDSVSGKNDRAQALRRAALERALQDERWDWISAHVDECHDDDLLRTIAQKANALGMHDWVLAHMNGYADTSTIDAAIEAGNWSWLGDHVWQFEDALQQKIALAAAKAENWQWLSMYSEQIAMEGCVEQIALEAYAAEARVLALQLAEHFMNAEQRERLADAAVARGDMEFLDMLEGKLSSAYYGRLCIASARAGDWKMVESFVAKADRASVETMMEIAISNGNFDAIDILNAYL